MSGLITLCPPAVFLRTLSLKQRGPGDSEGGVRRVGDSESGVRRVGESEGGVRRVGECEGWSEDGG